MGQSEGLGTLKPPDSPKDQAASKSVPVLCPAFRLPWWGEGCPKGSASPSPVPHEQRDRGESSSSESSPISERFLGGGTGLLPCGRVPPWPSNRNVAVRWARNAVVLCSVLHYTAVSWSSRWIIW